MALKIHYLISCHLVSTELGVFNVQSEGSYILFDIGPVCLLEDT